MKSYSQSRQDEWVHSLIGDKGTFLDIGAGHPTEKSNTYALEQLGWTGLLIDRDLDKVDLLYKERNNPVLCRDVSEIGWNRMLEPKPIDYLSLDVDSSIIAFDVIALLTLTGWTFRSMTIEHELYKEGPEGRDAMRFFLLRHGYRLERGDVPCEGLEKFPYEDWWIQCKG